MSQTKTDGSGGAVVKNVSRRGVAAVALGVLGAATVLRQPREARAALPPPGPGSCGCNVYDITAFGALPNGPDVTSAINAAIQAANAAGGGEVYVPPGIWYVNPPAGAASSSIEIHGNVSLRGAAPGPGTLWPSRLLIADTFPANASVIRLADIDQTTSGQGWGAEISNLVIQSYVTNPNVVAIDFSSVSYGKIEGVLVTNQAPTRPPGGIAILMSDHFPGGSCFWNRLSRVQIYGYETALSFDGSNGNVTQNGIEESEIIECTYGVAIKSVGDIALSMVDVYLATSTGLGKAFRNLGAVPVINMINVQPEGYQASGLDWPAAAFVALSNPGGRTAVFNGWVQVDALMVAVDPTYGSGGNAATAVGPFAPFVGLNVGPWSYSYWAKIPAGTPLAAGRNTFAFYSNANLNLPAPPDGMFVRCVVTTDGGIDVPFTLFATPSVTPTVNTQINLMYVVTLTVAQAVVALPSDLVFFLDACRGSATGGGF
jgi:Pectate lyase superfamily protein